MLHAIAKVTTVDMQQLNVSGILLSNINMKNKQ